MYKVRSVYIKSTNEREDLLNYFEGRRDFAPELMKIIEKLQSKALREKCWRHYPVGPGKYRVQQNANLKSLFGMNR